jgi:hypothetical protein
VLRSVVLWIWLAVLVPLLVFCGLRTIGRLSQTAEFWMGVGVFVLSLGNLVELVLRARREKQAGVRQAEARAFAQAVAALLCGLALFFMASPVLHIGWISTTGESLVWWRWVLYYVEQLANVLLLGVPQALGLGISGIAAASDETARIAVAFLRFVIGAGALKYLITFAKPFFRRNTTFYATLKECYCRCAELASPHGMVLICEGEVARARTSVPVCVGDFLAAHAGEAFNEGVLV